MEPKIQTIARKPEKDVTQDDMSILEATLKTLKTKIKSAVELNVAILEKPPDKNATQRDFDNALEFDIKIQTQVKKISN